MKLLPWWMDFPGPSWVLQAGLRKCQEEAASPALAGWEYLSIGEEGSCRTEPLTLASGTQRNYLRCRQKRIQDG